MSRQYEQDEENDFYYPEDGYEDDGFNRSDEEISFYSDNDNYADYDGYADDDYDYDRRYIPRNHEYDSRGQENRNSRYDTYGDEEADLYEQEEYEEDPYYGDQDELESVPAKRKKNSKSRRRIIFLVIELLVLLLVLGALYLVTRVDKVEKADLPEEVIEENISEEVKESAETGMMKGYRNLVFFGVDSTKGDLKQNTRSDAIMICSINEDTGEVKLVSVYRDTLLNLYNDEYNKCNAAYAKGGPEQAINMLNMNLDLNITDFVTVGFGGLTDVVDALGGIEISVEEEEISHLNNYQSTMAKEINYRGNGTYDEVTQPGLQKLNGLQATAYCRIRYTAGWDYKRAARQREVLYAVADKAKQASPSELIEIANNAFSKVYTSLDLQEILDYVAVLQKYNFSQENTEEMQNGFPQLDQRIQANLGGALGDCVIPRNLDNNVVWLHQFLFEDMDYQVSEMVQYCSNHIADMTEGAVPEEMTDADHT